MDQNEYKYELRVGQKITADDLGATYFNVYERKCPPELPAGFWDKKPRVFAIERVTEEYYILRIANIVPGLGFSYTNQKYFYDDIMITQIKYNQILTETDPVKAWLARWTITPR